VCGGGSKLPAAPEQPGELALPKADPTMQILQPFAGSVQQYLDQPVDFESPRPKDCPQCEAGKPLTGHGFYTRTIINAAFDGEIRVRRYLCQACRRTVSLLPEFALPYLRSSVTVIALWLLARLLPASAGERQPPPPMPYQRGQFWLRRFRSQAEARCAALAHLATPPAASTFAQRALVMLEAAGRRLFSQEVRSSVRQSDLAGQPDVRSLGGAARRR
jgi:hypothetical protein